MLNNFNSGQFDFNSFLETKLNELKSDGRYRKFIEIDKNAKTFPVFSYTDSKQEIKSAVNWCSNDYLALSTSDKLIQATLECASQYGIGSGGTRNISGSTILHQKLEKKLADWHQQESALLFNSAYQANLTTLSTLGRHIPDMVFISDEENHASLIEGMRSCPNTKIIFKHNDLSDLESILRTLSPTQPKIIVFESIYSISGTVAPVREIISIGKKYHALTYIDEVHAVGLYGKDGSGKIEEFNLNTEVDFINGTLSKAIGTFGGYISASAKWIDFIRSFASGFIFTTSLPPAICSAALFSIEEIVFNQKLRNHFFKNVSLLRSKLDEAGIPYRGIDSHITQLVIGEAIKCKQISDHLLSFAGIYVQPINSPTVPKGQECIRITITPRHSFDQIHSLVYHLKGVFTDNIILSGRSSMLSKVQIGKVRDKINAVMPWIKTEENYIDTRGDQLTDIPLHTQEGTDFFTDNLSEALKNKEIDIAVHSLKDLSSEHFFGGTKFAVVDRDEVRDVAIFNEKIADLLRAGEKIRIGTCSFRRESLAGDFLKKVLPAYGQKINIEILPIRGNIDTRLKKLSEGRYDGIILAFAGINRMLTSVEHREYFKLLLSTKRMMVLPLLDCTPAPCQGAIAAESSPQNERASYILNCINNIELYQDCTNEKKIASEYGSGCIQKFGVTTVKFGAQTSVYAHGIDSNNNEIDTWYGLKDIRLNISNFDIINSDELGFVAEKTILVSDIPIPSKAVFISHIAAIEMPYIDFSNLRVWTAGIETWIKLAAKNIWVEGCADSLGFNSIFSILNTPLIDIQNDITVLTNEESAERWTEDNIKAIATYSIHYKSDLIDKYKLKSARLIFWSCFAHFNHLKEILPAGVLHSCLPGKTAELLRKEGHQPILFPTKKAFNQWKKKYIQVPSVA